MKIPDEWTFQNAAVAAGFDSHVREQLPWYDLLTGLLAHCGRHYIGKWGKVYDIGASTGNVGIALAEVIRHRGADFHAIEESVEMAAKYVGGGTLHVSRAEDFYFEEFDFATLHLVMMFMPVAIRGKWLAELCKSIKPGGAILITDKTEPLNGYLATVMWRATLAGKVATGTPPEQIIAKELSLAGVQRPISREELPASAVEIFRFADFAAWIIEGPKS